MSQKVPETFLGRCAGTTCAILGLLDMAFSLPIIVFGEIGYFYMFQQTKRVQLLVQSRSWRVQVASRGANGWSDRRENSKNQSVLGLSRNKALTNSIFKDFIEVWPSRCVRTRRHWTCCRPQSRMTVARRRIWLYCGTMPRRSKVSLSSQSANHRRAINDTYRLWCWVIDFYFNYVMTD